MRGNIYKGLFLYIVLENGDAWKKKKEQNKLKNPFQAARAVSARNNSAFLHANEKMQTQS